jgi:UDP-N-acetylmuramoylalanine--D-glutamate ligase
MREPIFSQLPRPQPEPLAGRRLLVLGAGDTGLSVARWAARAGASVRVADTRDAPPRMSELAGALVTGRFTSALLEGVDLVCVSPGVALSEPIVREALARRLPVLGDIELFAWAVRARPGTSVLAVTGTNGKSTVTALLGHLLRSAGVDGEVAGNIGPAALEALLRRAERPPAAWVLELSSYQLETTWSLEPQAAALLNLSEDHLDRYGGLDAYAAAKARIFMGAGVQVLNRDDARSMACALPGRRVVTFGRDAPQRAEDFGIGADGGRRWLQRGADRVLALDELPLFGLHNALNALAACALAQAAGVSPDAMAAGLRGFRGLPHRLERVALRRGVAWYDDSKGTNVGAAIAALEGLGGRCVLIAGGDGKGQDFAPLAEAVARHASAVMLIGRDAPLLRAALAGTGVPLTDCASLEEAVDAADSAVRPGEAVLLSPACASLDMFRNYGHRAQVFVAAVQQVAQRDGQPC